MLSNIPDGLYILTASGELGVYDEQRQLRIDKPLSQTFQEHNRVFLQGYLEAPHTEDRRSAILFESSDSRAWGHTIFSLEESAVRTFYPTGGRTAAELTTFQQKSREKSVYRGLELLLEYRRDNAPDTPFYCPVLFDAGATLAQRATAIGRQPDESERATPVIDVLNLAATIPPARRAAPEIQSLVEKLHAGVIHKELRRDSEWSVLQKRAQPVIPADANMFQLHASERVDSVERWLKVPHQPVGSDRLHRFAQFRALDSRRLDEWVAPSLIYTAPAGVRLLEHGQRDAWNLYLLDGALNLLPMDGVGVRVEGGSDKAMHPIASLKPRKYRVETLTSVNFLWVHDRLLAALSKAASQPVV